MDQCNRGKAMATPEQKAPTVVTNNVIEMGLPEDPTPTQLLAFLSRFGLDNVMVVYENTVEEHGEAYSDTYVLTAGRMTNERALWIMEKAKLGLMGMEI